MNFSIVHVICGDVIFLPIPNIEKQIPFWVNHCVGFINSGSLMDRLPNKGSAQQTTLRTTRKLLGRPKYLNDSQKGDPTSDRKA